MLRADRSDELSAIGINVKRKPFDSSSIVVVIRATSKSSGYVQYAAIKEKVFVGLTMTE